LDNYLIQDAADSLTFKFLSFNQLNILGKISAYATIYAKSTLCIAIFYNQFHHYYLILES